MLEENARPTMAAPDPHCISDQLDEETSCAIVSRLESRGKDAVFIALFDTYFKDLLALPQGQQRVLEVGSGTGVLGRRLFHQGFRGEIVGVDQSSFFVKEAQRLASEECVDGNVVRFAVADARALQEQLQSAGFDQLFDCVILHTLISHVEDPASVLRSVRAVVKPGAMMFIVDGDYPSLTYGVAAGGAAEGEVEQALVQATFVSPNVVRQLPGLLTANGWAGPMAAQGTCVSEVGAQFSYWKSFAEAYMPRVKKSGLVEPDSVDLWWVAQKLAASEGKFFAACSYYTFKASAS